MSDEVKREREGKHKVIDAHRYKHNTLQIILYFCIDIIYMYLSLILDRLSKFLRQIRLASSVYPRSLDQFYIMTYHIK